jgi:iron complex outermembrane receptor protein
MTIQLRPVAAGLAIAFGGLAALTGAPAFAQDTQKLERVEITGSSIKRIEGETALPVQVITREDIQRTGASNVEQLLQTISAAASSQALTASSASGATTGGISSVSLRGLSSLRTLVLINGRRVAPYGQGFTGDSVSVDVNSIPLAAIERVEVLKDGASAIYGSDAIAGVINFILRKDFKGMEVTGEYGDTTDGGARLQRITGAYGYGDLGKDRFNVMVVASYQKEDPLFGRDRKFASSGITDKNDTTSGNTFPGNLFLLDGTGRARNPSVPTCPGPYAILDPNFPPNRCRFDPSPLVTLVQETERTSIFASAKFAVTANMEAFIEGSFNRNEGRTVIQPVPLSDQFTLPSNNVLFSQPPYNGFYPNDPARFGALAGKPTGLSPGFTAIISAPGDKYYPTAYVQSVVGAGNPLPNVAVRYRSAETGNRDLTDIAEAPRLTFGVKGVAAGWDYDAAFLYSQSKVREQVNGGYPALSKVMPLLNSGNVNLWGPNTPDITAQLKATNFTGDAFKIDSNLTSVAGKASREIFQMPAGPFALAVGGEYRKEKLNWQPNATIETGDISGYGGNFLTTDKSRDVKAVFAEVNVPLVKGLEANAAVRYDDYEGVGNSTTPKFSLRWQPTREILLRASYGQGFRAPSLQDLYLPNTTGVTVAGLNDPIRCPVTGNSNDCKTQFAVTFGGNSKLKPEKSDNYTLGIVLEPTNNISVALDLFWIKLTDTITNGVNAASIVADVNSLARYGSLVTRGAADPAFPNLPGPIINIDQTNINLGETRLSGFDIDAKWSLPAGDMGKFTLGLAGTYFSKYDTQNPDDGSFSGAIDQANNSTGGVVPRWKHYLTVNWVRGPWDVTLAQNYQGGYTDFPYNNSDDIATVGPYVTYDFQGSYTGFKNLRLTLGARNLFNTDPPRSNVGGTICFQAGYDCTYADPRGRFIYGRLQYSFK